MFTHDPRLQTGAYITDGIDLYEVRGIRRGPGVMGAGTLRVLVENCRDHSDASVSPDRISTGFALVRHPPRARCPDAVDQIAW